MSLTLNSIKNFYMENKEHPYLQEFLTKLDLTNTNVIIAAIMVILCPVTWNLVARIEFYTRYFTKKCKGNNILAADIFAHVLIEMGLFRNYMLKRAIDYTYDMTFSENVNVILDISSYLLFSFGFLLVAGAYYQLGIHGIYYADYFGILMKERCTKFPYNRFDNPLYHGSQLMFASYVLSHKSPTGVLLLVLLCLMYKVAEWLENPMTVRIYSQKSEYSNNNNTNKIEELPSQSLPNKSNQNQIQRSRDEEQSTNTFLATNSPNVNKHNQIDLVNENDNENKNYSETNRNFNSSNNYKTLKSNNNNYTNINNNNDKDSNNGNRRNENTKSKSKRKTMRSS